MGLSERLIEDEVPLDLPANKGEITITPDGAVVKDVVVSAPISTDWAPVFAIFNLDADAFVIVDDTVRMKTWQQSKALEDGSRDIVQLYSYGARFTRRSADTLTDAEIADHRSNLQVFRAPRARVFREAGTPVTAVINLADMQAFKSEGGGIDGLTSRLTSGLENTVLWLERMKSAGRNIEGIALVNNGDPYEGVDGNYASQLFTVGGNTRAQMNYVLDAWAMFGKELFPRFKKADWVSVLCNHSELGRLGGGKNRTGDSDSGGAFLSEAYKRILDGRSEYAHVEWTIPHDEFNVFTELSGVPVGFNHGHKIPGNDATGFEKWLNGQARGNEDAHRAKVWFIAHRHNLQFWDLGSTVVIQCSSSDGGSKWLTDMTGKYSHSGITAALVGTHDKLSVTDLVLL